MAADRLRTPDVDALLEALLTLATPTRSTRSCRTSARSARSTTSRSGSPWRACSPTGRHYSDIEAATGASSTTISRVSRALNYGADGYRLVLDRLPGGEGDRSSRVLRPPAHALALLAAGRSRPRRRPRRARRASSRCRRWRSPTTASCSAPSSSTRRPWQAGVKPIIGCEVYFTPGDRRDRSKKPELYHLLLLAKDLGGLPQPHGAGLRRRTSRASTTSLRSTWSCSSATRRGSSARAPA